MFKFKAYTEEECQELAKPALLAEGEYNFEIIKVTDEAHDKDGNMTPLVSGNGGNPMMIVDLKIWDENGEIFNVRDWLVLTTKWMFKIRHLCEACNLLDVWESGQLHASNLVGRAGRVKITTQKGKEIPKEKRKDGGKTHYDDSNSVQDYIKPRAKQKETKTTEGFFDDDIKM